MFLTNRTLCNVWFENKFCNFVFNLYFEMHDREQGNEKQSIWKWFEHINLAMVKGTPLSDKEKKIQLTPLKMKIALRLVTHYQKNHPNSVVMPIENPFLSKRRVPLTMPIKFKMVFSYFLSFGKYRKPSTSFLPFVGMIRIFQPSFSSLPRHLTCLLKTKNTKLILHSLNLPIFFTQI